MMTGYMKLGFDISKYPNAYAYYANEITLPLNTRMELDDVDYVCEVFHECYGALVAEGIS